MFTEEIALKLIRKYLINQQKREGCFNRHPFRSGNRIENDSFVLYTYITEPQEPKGIFQCINHLDYDVLGVL